MYLLIVLAMLNSCTDDDLYTESIDPLTNDITEVTTEEQDSPLQPDPDPDEGGEDLPEESDSSEDEALEEEPVEEEPVEEEPVEEEPVEETQASHDTCVTQGGKADERGLKTWCWNDITIPEYTSGKGPRFADNHFVVDSECDPNAVSIENGRVKFNLIPRNPPTSNNTDCYRNYNCRAEIRTNPWDVKNPLGTEEWYGFTYTFGDDYKIHQNKHWYLFQVYPGPEGLGPQVHLQTSTAGQFGSNPAGELFFYRQPADNDRNRKGTGIVPKAGDALKIVCHFVWGIGDQGRTRVWINDTLVYESYGSNVKLSHPYGGNLKIGIYKSGWNNLSQIMADENNGIYNLTTYLGDLKIVTRRPGDSGYGTDSYNDVAPH